MENLKQTLNSAWESTKRDWARTSEFAKGVVYISIVGATIMLASHPYLTRRVTEVTPVDYSTTRYNEAVARATEKEIIRSYEEAFKEEEKRIAEEERKMLAGRD